MKGVSQAIKIIITIFIGVLGIVLALILLMPLIGGPSQAENIPKVTFGQGFFDYKPYLRDDAAANNEKDYLESESFCSRLKRCLVYSWQTGERCEVGHAAFGTEDNLHSQLHDLINNGDELLLPFGYGCSSEDLWYYPIEGVQSHICKYNEVKSTTVNRHGSQSGLTYDDCRIYNGDDKVLYHNEYVELGSYPDPTYDLASDADIHISVDELYTPKTFDVSAASTKVDIKNFMNLKYNGAGKYKFVVDGVTVDDSGNCRYNLLLCSQPSIASSSSEPIIKLFDIMRTLPTYHFDVVPYYVSSVDGKLIGNKYEPDGSGGYKSVNFDYPSGQGPDVYYFSEYTIDLGSYEYPIVQIFNAVKAGFEAKGSEMNWAGPFWELYADRPSDQKPKQSYTTGWDIYLRSYSYPWNEYGDSELTGYYTFRERTVFVNCGDDEICQDEIKVKIGFRRDPENTDSTASTAEKVWHSIIIAIMEKQ